MLLKTLLLASLATAASADVIVELRKSLRPFRIFEDKPARFGDALPSNGLVGLVVAASPLKACSPIQPPPKSEKLPSEFVWIALIERGDNNSSRREDECTFQKKVERAQEANYSAVIIFNNISDDIIPMGGDAEVMIPSVFVGLSDGKKILTKYTYKQTLYAVRLTENTPFDINSYLLPFAIVVGICFIIMLGIMIFKCVQDRRRERRHRLPKSTLKKIPTHKFVAGDEEHYETCCICLEDYVVGDKLRILPCQHAYHIKCIDPWLLKNKRVCPQCRKKVFANDELPPSDTDSDTDDERAPLIRRGGAPPTNNTFTQQSENPFRRAARRLATRREQPAAEDGGSVSSSSTEGGAADQPEVRVAGRHSPPAVHNSCPPALNNQLLAEVHVEQHGRGSLNAEVEAEEDEDDAEEEVEIGGEPQAVERNVSMA